MKEYRQGDTVRLTATVQDPNGVSYVKVVAYHESTGPGATPPATTDEQISLFDSSPPQEPGPVEAELEGRVTDQVPGVYTCREIQAMDTLGHQSFKPLDPPQEFRIVESGQEDQEGPKILDVEEEFS